VTLLAIALLQEESHQKDDYLIKLRIIVAGAAGKRGGVVTTQLLKAGDPVSAMVRRKDCRSPS